MKIKRMATKTEDVKVMEKEVSMVKRELDPVEYARFLNADNSQDRGFYEGIKRNQGYRILRGDCRTIEERECRNLAIT